MALPQAQESTTEISPKKHRHLLASVVIIIVVIVVIVLIIPIIPIQYTVTKSFTGNSQYDAEVYDTLTVPEYVNVTNQDSKMGSFTITMDFWLNNYGLSGEQQQLLDSSVQSAYIQAGKSYDFYIPSNWTILPIMYSFTYSVSPPQKQIYYNVTQTKYESILTSIENSH